MATFLVSPEAWSWSLWLDLSLLQVSQACTSCFSEWAIVCVCATYTHFFIFNFHGCIIYMYGFTCLNVRRHMWGVGACVHKIDDRNHPQGWAWWRMPLIPALGRQRQVDFWVWGQPGLQSEFQDSQGYTQKPCLENQNKKQKQKTSSSTTLPPYSLRQGFSVKPRAHWYI